MNRQRTKRIAAVMAGAAIVGGAWIALDSNADHPERSKNRREIEPRSEAVERGVAPAEVQHLEHRLRRLESASAEKEAENRPAAPPEEEVAPHTERHEPDRDPAERVASEMAIFDTLLRSEPRDASWASTFTSSATSALAQFPGTRLENVECRSSLCKLEVTHDDEAVEGKFPLDIPSLVPDVASWWYTQHESVGPQKTIMYFVRNGHDMPDLSAN